MFSLRMQMVALSPSPGLPGLRVALLAALSILVTGSTCHAGSPRVLTPRYTITIPGPAARKVSIRCEFWGIQVPRLTFTFMNQVSPGLAPSFEAYRIHPVVHRSMGGSPATTPGIAVPFRTRRREDTNTLLLDVGIRGSREPLGNLTIEYDLDLESARGPSADPATLSRVYQGRMIVTDAYATLRGDTLFAPTGHTIDRPRIRVIAPPGWTTALNADREGEELVLPGRFPPDGAARSTHWFGLVGTGITNEAREVGRMRWSLAIAPTSVKPELLSAIVWNRIRHFSAVFGFESLSYLGLPPPAGVGRAALHLFAIPFPPEVEHVRGGQYMPGSAYFFYSRDCPYFLGHVMAHEYLHVYNCKALRHARDDGSESGADTWFREGYTDVQATLANLGLDEPDDARRIGALKYELVTAWALATGQDPDEVAKSLGLVSPTDEGHAEPGAPGRSRPPSSRTAEARPLATLDAATLRRDSSVYDREILGRSRLVVFRLAMLLERTRPGRKGFDAWLQKLLSDHGKAREGSQPVDADAIRNACLDAAGRGAPELEDFYQRYVEGNARVTLDQLRHWLEDDALRTMCPRITGRPASFLSPAPVR